jgi:hypothetical protein
MGTVVEPARHHVIVLVSGVHQGTLRVLAYAKGLNATSLTALSISLEPHESRRLLDEWLE